MISLLFHFRKQSCNREPYSTKCMKHFGSYTVSQYRSAVKPSGVSPPFEIYCEAYFFLFPPYVFCSLAFRIRLLHVQRKVGNRDIKPEIDILQTDFALFPRAPCMTLWLPKAFSERASKISCQHCSLKEPNIAQFVLKSFGGGSFLFLFILFWGGNCSLWWPDALWSGSFSIADHGSRHYFNWYEITNMKLSSLFGVQVHKIPINIFIKLPYL